MPTRIGDSLDGHVAIIILNWNGWRDTIECISSLLDVQYDCYTIVVWDNGSSDSSVGKIENHIRNKGIPYLIHNESDAGHGHLEYPMIAKACGSHLCGGSDDAICSLRAPKVHIIEGKANRGFAGGCNAGIDFASRFLNPQYFLLLNNDTVVKKDFLEYLVRAAASHPRVGILGPTILYYDMNGRKDIIWGRGGVVNFRKYPFLRHLDNSLRLTPPVSDEIVECDWVSGAALMFSSSITEKRLDPTFFFGNEDVDFCMINREYGWKTCVVHESIVWHKSGKSRRKRYVSKIAESFEYLRQNMKLFGKHEKHRFLAIPLITVQFVILTMRTTLEDLKSILA